ncbi:MAG TPA: hypothetical protein VF169_25000 [Albitalea sp.]|uniref:hypothetical protein n=1 Tax=Piscinibacter sp. TaxID=1903157 RepID=UPI002ED6314B
MKGNFVLISTIANGVVRTLPTLRQGASPHRFRHVAPNRAVPVPSPGGCVADPIPGGRTIMTKVEHALPGKKVFHGTSSARARSILDKGFDLSRAGQNYQGFTRAGPGVYASTSLRTAQVWGSMAAGGDAVQVIEIYPPEEGEGLVRLEVPQKVLHGPVSDLHEFAEAHPEAHILEMRHRDGGATEVLFTRHAMEDPNVVIGYRAQGKAMPVRRGGNAP